jgi:hypothetical protein
MPAPAICKNTEPADIVMPNRLPVCAHVWQPHPSNENYLTLKGVPNGLVRAKPTPQGRYLWQFRKIVSYADTLQSAKDYVEAGTEFFAVFRRNPYSA